LRIGAIETTDSGRVLPVRMLNEFTYCPRLFFLEWVQGEFEDNHFTVEGRTAHRRVDARAGTVPPPPADSSPEFRTRSVELSSEVLGLSARIDMVEGEGRAATPIDYKRGKPPPIPESAWEPERVQLCAYGLLLREHGYEVDHGILYFAEARRRVEIPFDEVLVARTLELLRLARETADRGQIPPPLTGSPKCQGCSLNAICLPDETNLLRENAREENARQDEGAEGDDGAEEAVAAEEGVAQKATLRRLVPPSDDQKPIYVVEQGARVGISGLTLEVRDRERNLIGDAPLVDVSQVILLGNVQVSSQAIRELCGREVPICWMSFGGWLAGMTDGVGHNNVEVRRAQFRAADDQGRALALARRFVRAKIANCRTLLRRNLDPPDATSLQQMSWLIRAADRANDASELLGVEGNAARIYFEQFPGMLRPPAAEGAMAFDFTTRTRRPPRDPVNALLSLAYSLLAKDMVLAARSVGLDPFVGFYHRPRFGRPALALDLMEEFRPIVADSVVLSAVNNGVVGPDDFVRSSLGVALTTDGRRRFLRAYERRLEEEITHPVFGYRISYRRVLTIQCRLLARHLTGEVPHFPEFRTR
jgi:CRISPR-associated protein Cas1